MWSYRKLTDSIMEILCERQDQKVTATIMVMPERYAIWLVAKFNNARA